MKTIEVDCFEITQPDGGGVRDEHICFASTKRVAESIVKHLGPGWPQDIRKFNKAFTVVESFEEYLDHTMSTKRANAAAKLTKEDRATLGIDIQGNYVR